MRAPHIATWEPAGEFASKDLPEERYYVGRPLFRGQENCNYFTPRTEPSYIRETADRFESRMRETSPPFTPCAAREESWEAEQGSEIEKDIYDESRGFYLSVEVGSSGFGPSWAPTATPESYGVYPSMYEWSQGQYYDEGRQNSLVCAICDEDIVAKGRRFGLLENCSHPFCLECIRRWRDQKDCQDKSNLRLCPLCRVESFLITPSEKYLPQSPEKDAVIRTYKEALSRIPCKFVTAGEECPFGTSCHYKHYEEPQAVTDRYLRNADGKVQHLRNPKLSDFMMKE